MPNVRRRSGQMEKPRGRPIKNAVTQRVDSATRPKTIKNQVAPASTMEYGKVKNSVTDCKY